MITLLLRLTCVATVCALVPTSARAQTDPRWDVAATAGLFTGDWTVDGPVDYRERWTESALGGVVVGRHLTRHLKLEIEASATGEGTQFIARQVTGPGLPRPYPVSSEVFRSTRSIATAVTWQFFDNQWVHPFVQAGVSTDFDRQRERVWPQFFYPGTGVAPVPLPQELDGRTSTRTTARALLGGGVKLYISERAFVRTEGRFTAGERGQHVAFRAGVGIDF